jgi:hypothetical protein
MPRHESLHLLLPVRPALPALAIAPLEPLLLATIAFKTGNWCIMKGLALTSDMDINDMMVEMCLQLLPPKSLATLAARLTERLVVPSE